MSEDTIINGRNIRALAEAERQSRKRYDAVLDRLNRLETMVAMSNEAVTQLRQQFATLLVMRSGHGPTSRSD